MDLQIIAAIIFVISLVLLIFIKRKDISIEKLIFPVFYMFLYRTKFGLKFMDKTAEKYRELIKIIGYSCIGFGFLGMIFITVSIVYSIGQLFIKPETASSGMALVLPFTTVPGVGYLPFMYWIISLFILMVVHEGAHGIMARAHDVKVKSSGFAAFAIFAPILPGAFVEIDEKECSKKPDHVQYAVSAAGPIANVALAFLILLFTTFIMVPIEKGITEPVGFSFDVTNESSPAYNAGLRSGTLITSYNNNTILDATKTVEDVYYCGKPGDTIYFGNKTGNYPIVLGENPSDKSKGYMGIMNIKNERDVKKKYAWLKPSFYWIQGLLKWLALLNFFIGMANLLPLAILDGGRMSKLALERTMKNKKKAQKIFVFISLLLFFFLIYGLVTQYLGNPLGFLAK